MHRSPRLVTILLLVTASSLVAVAAPDASAATTARLRGTNWVLTDRVSLGTPLQDVAVNAVFGAKRVTGSSGCNGYSSSYTTKGSAGMTIVDDGVSTQIACEGAAGKVESVYRSRLYRVGRYRITGRTLTLSSRTGRHLLAFRSRR